MPGLRHRVNVRTHRPEVFPDSTIEKIGWRERAAAEPFRGVAGGDGIVPGLFLARRTGADVSSVTRAGREYLSALTPVEAAIGRFPVDHVSRRHWANGAWYFLRHGLLLDDLDSGKRARVLEIVRLSLSEYGYTLVRDLMKLNPTIGELRGETDELNEWVYWFSVYGSPESGDPWGWQLDGHHVCVNCAIIGDQMVITPTFLGAEPVIADAGKYAGTSVFRREESLAEEFCGSLSPAQRSAAVLGDKLPRDLFTGAFRDNFELNYEGLRFDELTAAQWRRRYGCSGSTWTGSGATSRSRTGRRWFRTRRKRISAGFGGTDVFYYRIHSPVILIEFEHQHGVMFDNEEPTRNHIHTVVRTLNGNDYGRDILRQHHELYHS
jgi:hypothetical protein